MIGEQITARSVSIGEVGGSIRVVQIVVKAFARPIDAVFEPHRRWKILVGTGEARLAKNIQHNGLLQSVGKRGSFVGERARSELVAGDGRPATEEWMIVESEWLGRSGQQEFGPRADLVIGGGDMPRIVLE